MSGVLEGKNGASNYGNGRQRFSRNGLIAVNKLICIHDAVNLPVKTHGPVRPENAFDYCAVINFNAELIVIANDRCVNNSRSGEGRGKYA